MVMLLAEITCGGLGDGRRVFCELAAKADPTRLGSLRNHKRRSG